MVVSQASAPTQWLAMNLCTLSDKTLPITIVRFLLYLWSR
jgi:hypothetical protein